jgi:hypothetical protein
MTSRPPVDIVLFTVVLKETAAAGMSESAVQAYKVWTKSGLLTRILRSRTEAEAEARALEGLGLKMGRDFTVASMIEGPLVPCAGISFSNLGNCAVAQWSAVLNEEGPIDSS